MKKEDIKYVTIITGDDGWTVVKTYSNAKRAMLAAREYIKSWPLKKQHRTVSDYGQVVETMSIAAFSEACENNMIPEYEIQHGY